MTNKFEKVYNSIISECNESLVVKEQVENDNIIKYFKNGKTFSSYCRFRYGSSKKVWDDQTLWQQVGKYAISLNQTLADEKFGVKNDGSSNPLKPRYREAAWDEENYEERRREDMMDYIHSGAGLDAYYADQEAGYAYQKD